MRRVRSVVVGSLIGSSVHVIRIISIRGEIAESREYSSLLGLDVIIESDILKTAFVLCRFWSAAPFIALLPG